MQKSVCSLATPFAIISLLLLTGCSSTDEDVVTQDAEVEETQEALLPTPAEQLDECNANGNYTEMDGGDAAEFEVKYIDVDPVFLCVVERIGLPEATLATGKPGDTMQAEGYKITIMKSGNDQKAVIQRD